MTQLGTVAFSTGLELSRSGRPETAAMFIFGIVAALAVIGDSLMMRAGGIQGPPRLKREIVRLGAMPKGATARVSL